MDRTFREEKNQKNNAQNKQQQNAQNKQQRNAQNRQQKNAQDQNCGCGAENREQNRFEH